MLNIDSRGEGGHPARVSECVCSRSRAIEAAINDCWGGPVYRQRAAVESVKYESSYYHIIIIINASCRVALPRH